MAANDKDRPDQTLADFVAITISPALVMTLVGSLVLFLLEVCYTGEYVGRMRWTLCFYVFGIVLVCRIAMLSHISDLSWLYGVFLAGGTWLCLQGFIEYPHGSLIRALSPVINIGLIAIVWWSSGKLVRDCTNVDEDTDMSGEGLLQATGQETVDKESSTDKQPTGDEKTSASSLVKWWERYQRYRDKQNKKRILGIWVIYFSVAALPLFGLGQSLIPVGDLDRRQLSFWLLATYVASGLGLLMTTCFLSLRRYLRQRRLKMPAAMTAVWLTFGVTLIVVLLAVGAVIPRPQSEYPLIDLQALTGGEKSASKYAMKGDSPGKGDGRPGDPSGKSDAKGEPGGKQGDKGESKGKDGGDRSGEQKGDGDSGKGKGDGQKGSGQDNAKGGSGDKDGKDGQAKKDGKQQDSSDKSGKQDNKSDSRRDSSSPNSIIEKAGSVLKWIVFAIVGIVTAIVILFAIVKFLANFTGWAARWLDAWSRFWSRLFGGTEKKSGDEEFAIPQARARPPRPFGSYHNPFRLGQPWTPYEMVCYTFGAFEARSRELGVARQPGETPLEHAERLGEELPAWETDARRLALIYARGIYGSSELPIAVNDVLRQVWERMEADADRHVAV